MRGVVTPHGPDMWRLEMKGKDMSIGATVVGGNGHAVIYVSPAGDYARPSRDVHVWSSDRGFSVLTIKATDPKYPTSGHFLVAVENADPGQSFSSRSSFLQDNQHVNRKIIFFLSSEIRMFF